MNPTFRFAVATRLKQEEFLTRSAIGRSLVRYPVHNVNLVLNFENSKGLHSTYNQAIELSRNSPAVLVFVHDDVHLCDVFWQDRMLEALKSFDLVGLAGNRRRLPNQPSWAFINHQFQWDSAPNLSGTVAHGEGWPPNNVSVYGPPRQEVKLLDGLMLVAHSQTLIDHDIRFDERLDFHFYDLDICRQAEAKGLKIGTWDLSVVHESKGGAFGSPAWNDSMQKYFQKWGD